MIKELEQGDLIDGAYLIKDAVKGVTNAGLNYLTIILQDSSGYLEGKKWEVSADDLKICYPGNIVYVTGETNTYKGKLQAKIFSVKEVNKNNIDLSDLLIESPIKISILEEKFKNYLNKIVNPDCKAIVNDIFARYYKDFKEFPAATKNHHEFYHGLIYHTISMCELAEMIAHHYEDVDLDLLISGCLLHDLGKVIELSGIVGTKYTIEGNLLGHLTIGMAIIRETANKLGIKSEIPLLLEHMVLSHHGKLEYGSPVLPQTKEALILSIVDDLDANMMSLEKALEVTPEGEMSEKIFPLDNRSFYKPQK